MKFFGKERLDLMGNNNMRKYLKYALGEIFLIVIGILLALEINTLNKSWVDSKEEQKILYNLKLDFEYNAASMNKLIKSTNQKIQTNSLLLNLTGPQLSNSQGFSIDSLLGQATDVPLFLPREGFLDELINSGKLQIIKSAQLRNKLSIWKPSLEYLKNKEETTLYAMRRLGEYINAHGSWLNIDQYSSQMKPLIPQSSFKTNNEELLKSQEFQNYIDNDFWALNILKSKQEDMVKLNEDILAIINQELEN